MTTTRTRRLPANAHPSSALLDAFMEWQAAAVRLTAVDPVTTELVRLRCAQHHDCHT